MRVIIQMFFRFINVHLLNLLDGLPHEVPLYKVLSLDCGRYHQHSLAARDINGSRIALVVKFDSPVAHVKFIVWDWRTGEVVSAFPFMGDRFQSNLTQVFERSSADSGVGNTISAISSVYLLEGPWLLALSNQNIRPRLIIFNTLWPQQDASSWRILQLPRPSHERYVFSTRRGNSLAECPEFSADPAQFFFVVYSPLRTLVIPVEPFIRDICSVRVNPHLRWGDWAEYVMCVPTHPNTTSLQLVDTKLLALVNSQERWGVEVYDLSKSGQKYTQIQQVGEEQDGGCRNLVSTLKRFALCQLEEPPYRAHFVGNTLALFYVSLSRA